MDMSAFGRASAPVPTQSFAATNLLGTPVPQIGQTGANPTMGSTQTSIKKAHIATIVAAIVVIGLLLHFHFFEK